MLYLSCKKNENKQKEVGIKRIKRKTAYFIKKTVKNLHTLQAYKVKRLM